MPNKTIKIRNLRQLRALAKQLLARLEQQTDLEQSATVLALTGQLGAGKTALVKELAKLLGVTKAVTSPTFIIWQRYKLKNSRFAWLYHADCYRLKHAAELAKLGFAQLLADNNNLIVLEWAAKARELLPRRTVWLEIKLEADQKTRQIVIEWPNNS